MPNELLQKAVSALKGGRLAAFPTDTVYGVGAVAGNDAAVGLLYKAKRRPPDKPIPLFLAEAGQLPDVADAISPAAWRLAERYWPGPLTLVLRKAPSVSLLVSAGGETVAVRIPNHPAPLALVQLVGEPLAVTSANISGAPSPRTAQEVQEQIGDQVDVIIDGGPSPLGVESTIVDVSGERPILLREGALSWREILEVLQSKAG